jgi:hypothetical protein
MVESRRAEDMAAEKQLAKFLDEAFYPKVAASPPTRFDRWDDQKRGRDILVSFKGIPRPLIVDEKAQLHFINEPRPSFVFEIGSLQKGIPRTGWLIDETLETECYLLMWLWAAKTADLTAADITKVECMLISKEVVLAHLSSIKIDKAIMLGIEHSANKADVAGRYAEDYHPDVFFYRSKQLNECSFNIVVRKHVLDRLAARRWIVTRDSVEEISQVTVSARER